MAGSSFGSGLRRIRSQRNQLSTRTVLLVSVLFISFQFFAIQTQAALPLWVECLSDITVNNDSGQCGAVVNFTPPDVYEDCEHNGNSNTAVLTQIGGLPSGSLFPVGINVITFAASNDCGETDTCSFNIVVKDTELPTISCPSNVSFQANSSGCTATAIWGQPNVFDNCGITSVLGSHRARSPFPLGTTIVTYTVIDAAGNKNSCFFNVDVSPGVLSVNLTSTATCTGGSAGGVQATVNGGCQPYTYLWSNGQTGTSLSNLPVGTYSVTVTDANNNTQSAQTTVTSFNAISIKDISFDATCQSPNGGSIDLIPSGGLGPYTYQWSSGDSTSDLTGLSAGSYSVTVTDANGCTGDTTIVIGKPACCNVTLAGSIGSNQSNCGAFDPAVIVSLTLPSGGIGTLEYVWLQSDTLVANTTGNPHWKLIPGAIGSSYDPGTLTETTYFIRCARRSGCTAYVGESNVVTITVHPAPSINIQSTNPNCANPNGGVASVTVTQGTAPFSYAWSTGDTSASLSGLSSGTYSLTVTDANGCSTVNTLSLSLPACCNVTSAGTIGNDQSNCGPFDPAVIQNLILPSGGLGTLEYVWLQSDTLVTNTTGNPYWKIVPGANGSSYDPGMLTETTYFIRCARRSGCSAYVGESNVVAIVVNGSPALSLNSSNPSCPSSTDSVQVCQVSEYKSGDHAAWIKNYPGTADHDYVFVNNSGKLHQYPNGSAHLTGLLVNRSDSTKKWVVDVHFVNGMNWTAWSALGRSYKDESNKAGNNYLNWTYYVMDTSMANTLTGSGANQGTVLHLTHRPSNLKYGLQVGLAANSKDADYGFSCWFDWSDGSGQNSGVGDFNTDISCSSSTYCNGRATASASGGTAPYTYSWSNGMYGASLNGLCPGNYTVTVQDANGCSSTQSFSLAYPSCCNVTQAGVIGGDQNNCGPFDPSAITNVTLPSGGLGTLEYVWLQSDTLVLNTPNNPYWKLVAGANGSSYDPGMLTETTYFIRCARRSGCSAYVGESNVITIEVNSIPSLSIQSNNVSCTAPNGGTAEAIVTGGTAPFTYTWSNGDSSSTLAGLGSGSYSVTITDAKGCSASDSVTLSLPACCNVTAAGKIGGAQTNCGPFDPSAITNVTLPSGGLGTLEYVWLESDTLVANTTNNPYWKMIPGANSASYDPGMLTETTYFIRCARRSGCSAYVGESNKIKVEVFNVPSIQLSSTDPNCQDTLGGSATVTVSGGTAPFLIQWSDGQSSENAVQLTTGNYAVTVSDANGCFVDTSFTLALPGCCNVTAAGSISGNQDNCGPFDPAIIQSTTLPSGGLGSLEYVWLKSDTLVPNTPNNPHWKLIAGATGASYDPGMLTETTHYIRCARRSGCSAYIGESNVVSITINSSVQFSLTYTNVTCATPFGGSAQVSVTHGTAPYSYSWSHGASGSSVSNLRSGNYSVTVTDANGCDAIDSFSLALPTCCNVTAAGKIGNSQSNCGPFNPSAISNVTLPSGGIGSLEYIWLKSDTLVPNTLNNPYWKVVPGAVGSTYDPGTISQTTYYIRCSRRSNCSAYVGESNVVTMEVNPSISIILQSNDPTCTSPGGGNVSAHVVGGTAPFSYSWNTGASTSALSGLAGGTYDLTVTDAKGCSTSGSVTLALPPCCNVTAPGTIAGNQSNCGPFDPNAITSQSLPSGGVGNLEYVWIQSDTLVPVTAGNPYWKMIPGATGASYDPPQLSQTTYFIRCVRRSGCTTFAGESNPVVIQITGIPSVTINCPADISVACQPGNGGAHVSWSDPGASSYNPCQQGCPTSTAISGFFYLGEHNGHRYYCSKTSDFDWSEAITKAQLAGGHLAVINSAAENNFLAGKLMANDAWIGFTDEATEGQFKWVNGEAVNYTSWKPGEPNDRGGSSCTSSQHGSGADYTVLRQNGYWYDRSACSEYEFIMELPCGNAIQMTQIGGLASGSLFTPGTSTITYVASDLQSGASDTCSFDVTVGTCPAVTYCNSEGQNSSHKWIERVKLHGSFNHTSGNDGGYGDHTHIVGQVTAGQSHKLDLTPGYASTIYSLYWKVWVDWNQDGDFNDSGEKIFYEQGKYTRTACFTAPTSAKSGLTRMRVAMKYGSYPGCCEQFSYGEVEDYQLDVTNTGVRGSVAFEQDNTEEIEEESNGIQFEEPATENLIVMVRLYPNPYLGNGDLNLVLDANFSDQAPLQIINAQGQVVYETTLDIEFGLNRVQLRPETLSPGLYLIRMEGQSDPLSFIYKD